MNAEVIKAFTHAVREALLKEMGWPVEVKPPRVQGGPIQLREVIVVVALAQRIEGAVVLGLSHALALRYLSHALGDEVTAMDEVAQSGVGELANILAGAAVSELAEIGYPAVIFPPTVHLGPGSLTVASCPRLVFPVAVRFGTLDLHMAARLKP